MVVRSNGSINRSTRKLVRLLVWNKEPLSIKKWTFHGMIFNMTTDYRIDAFNLASAPAIELPDTYRPQ